MTKKEIVHLALLSLIAIVPIFFGGGRGDEVVSAVFALLVLFIASRKFEIGTTSAKPEQGLLLLFVLWALVNTFFFSVRPYTSFVALLPIVAGAILYWTLTSYKISDNHKQWFGVALVGAALVIVVWGISGYLSPEFLLHRISATFYQPNAFAGFLIIPIILSLWAALFGGKLRAWGSLASVILIAGLLLSFSRGGIISAIFALLVFLFFIIRESYLEKKLLFLRIGAIVLIVLIGFGISYGLYKVKFYNQHLASNQTTSVDSNLPFSGERPEMGETGFAFRLEVMRYAHVLMKERPFTGFGLDTFGQEVSRIQTSPAYWSSDPHNLYLRICMELGVIGGLLFVVFVVSIVLRQGRRLFLEKENLLTAAYFSGFLGVLLHNGADIDFMFPANVFLFFIVAGFLSSREEVERKGFVFNALFFTAALVLIPTALIYAGAYHFTLAKDALEKGKIADFEKRFFEALKWDSLSPDMKVFGSSVFLDRSDPEKVLVFLLEAKQLHPRDATAYLLLGRTYRSMGNNAEAERALRRAIELAPYRGLEAETYLLGVLRVEGKIKEAREVAKAGIARFPDSTFESVLWTDAESKSEIKFQRLLLESFLVQFQEGE